MIMAYYPLYRFKNNYCRASVRLSVCKSRIVAERWVVEENFYRFNWPFAEALCVQNLGMQFKENIFKFEVEWRG